jgi:hypothetical protein
MLVHVVYLVYVLAVCWCNIYMTVCIEALYWHADEVFVVLYQVAGNRPRSEDNDYLSSICRTCGH